MVTAQTHLKIRGVFRGNARLWTMQSIVIAGARRCKYKPFRRECRVTIQG